MNKVSPQVPPSYDTPAAAFDAMARVGLLGKALEAAANAIVITDRDGVLQWANPAFSALTGYALDEAIGRKPGELVRSGEQPAEFYETLWNTILAGRVWHGELVNKRRGGSLYHEELTITPVREADGDITHFIAVKRDISDRKAAERALRDSEAHFRLFYENAPVAYQSLDEACRLREVNGQWLAQLGYSREEVIGRWIGDFLAPGQEGLLARRFAEFVEQGVIAKAEYEMLRKDGERVTVSVDGRIDRDGGGRFKWTHCVLHNITAHKRMEEKLARLATTDHLTGLANRRSFIEQMVVALARHRRHGISTALLMVDLDRFKQVNDAYGHASGDAVLRGFAATAVRVLRRVDLIGRLGGEEFAVLLPDTDIDGALDFAERLRREIAATPMLVDTHRIAYTASIGVTLFDATDDDTDSVLARADRAMYRAKRRGRDRVELEIASNLT